MFILRVLLNLLILFFSIMVILFGLCYVISNAPLGVSFLSLSTIKIGTVTLHNIPMFHPIELLKWFSNPSNIGKAYMQLQLKFVVPFAIGAFLGLMLFYIVTRVLRASANKKTTLHGSAKWATDDELDKLGMFGKSGIVLGQTFDAKYIEEKSKKPKRNRKTETRKEYHDRLMRWTNKPELAIKREGDLILQQGNAHTLVVGSTRSGKGVSCIIPTAFMWSESMIIFDPKAESWDITAAMRSKFSYAFKFQPENPKESIHYNPLLSIRRGTSTMPDIQNLSLALIALNEESKDPFWDNEARKLLATVIGYVVYCMPPEKKTFKTVYSIFTDENKAFEEQKNAEKQQAQSPSQKTRLQEQLEFYSKQIGEYITIAKESLMMSDAEKERYENRFNYKPDERKKIERDVEGKFTKDDINNMERIRQDLAYFSTSESRQLSSVLSTMMSNLQVIGDPNVQEITDRSDFTMEDFVDGVIDEKGEAHPLSLYLCLSLASMERLTPIMKIFYNQAITLLTRDLKKRKFRLLLIFDEFRQMGKMDVVEKALSLAAGYGIMCMIVIQSFDQLKTIYRSDALFTDNFAYQVILRVNDPVTCKKVEEMLGQSTQKHTRLNASGNLGELVHKHESYDVQEMGRSLMTAEEVRTMPEDDVLIIMSGHHPYKGKKIRYYLDSRFRSLYLTKNGRGKQLPPPKIEDNYPHPETIVYNNKHEIVRIEGLDNEGWHLLKGLSSNPEDFVKQSMSLNDGIPLSDDIIDDLTNDDIEDRVHDLEDIREQNNKLGIEE